MFRDLCALAEYGISGDVSGARVERTSGKLKICLRAFEGLILAESRPNLFCLRADSGKFEDRRGIREVAEE